MLTVKVDGLPAVHFTYDRARACVETAVTVLDQAPSAPCAGSRKDEDR
jgi:hypothetical protein